MRVFWLHISDEFYAGLNNRQAATTEAEKLRALLETLVVQDVQAQAGTLQILEKPATTLFERISNYYLYGW